MIRDTHPCPECDAAPPSRRRFLKGAGIAAAVVATGGLSGLSRALQDIRVPVGAEVPRAEDSVKRLFNTLTAEQKKVVALPIDHPSTQQISANWHIVQPRIGEFYTADQKRIIHEILRGVASEDGYERMLRQMQEDDQGFDRYACAIAGNPNEGPAHWVMTGRHLTIRADGNSVAGRVFGGPVIYGHGSIGNTNANLFYYQTQAANEVFKALDAKQREKALVPEAPSESADGFVAYRTSGFAGIAVRELSEDQQGLVHSVMEKLLAPYREADVKEAVGALRANGGWDPIHMSFYKSGDISEDGEWDIWRLESPLMVWHFRGSPHVHAYVNMRTKVG